MMDNSLLTMNKEYIIPLLRRIHKNQEIIAPVKEKEDVLFSVIKSMDEITLDYKNAVLSPKGFFFPQQEVIFKYKEVSGDYELSFTITDKKRLIFGIRSCDLKALSFLDAVYLGRYKDPYYQKKREDTTLINLVCVSPDTNCFCVYANSGPMAEEGFDLQFVPLSNRFTIHVGSKKGQDIVEKYHYLFQEGTQKDLDEEYEVVHETKTKFLRYGEFATITQKLIQEEVEESLWKMLGDRCQNCGGCAYVCPTCSCFNVIDRPTTEREGVRIRTWDSCTLFGFTHLAEGLNPRKEKKDRIKRRFYHKLDCYMGRWGTCGCVGCGRCVTACLGGIDMSHVIHQIRMEEYGEYISAKDSEDYRYKG
ncbi:MAG: 4Fe-4S dicluster domain-containing protein [bacterium]|nr:4Fe-4S dicluster domain-containing protein [bacterium]